MKFFPKFTYLEEFDVLVHKVNLDYTINDIKWFILKVMKDGNFHSDMKVLIDLQSSTFIGKHEDIDGFIDWLIQRKISGFKTISFLTTNPQQVVMVKIFTTNILFKHKNYEDFSTLESSIKHLGVNVSNYELFKKVLNELTIPTLAN
ncbi:MAG: hypothetical protein Q8S44_06670 [Flavobacteriaceae bacterium]|nr:hypothetical protein [Flavobacteriaceae bacterium]